LYNSEVVRCCSASSGYCFIVRIVFGNALVSSAGRKAEEPEWGVKELDAQRIRAAGVFGSLLLARECAKGKRRHTRKRMDMCGDPWRDRKATLWFIYTPVLIVS